MDISTRLLTFVIELVYVPAAIDDKKCREIFDKVSDSHSIVSYNTLPDGSVAMGSKEEKNNLIKYRILRDRVVLSYDFCSNSLNYYQGLASDFMEKFCAVTSVGLFLVHNIIIRKLANIRGIEDSRDFLVKKVFSLNDENLRKFGRPLHMLGTRIFFPPVQEDQVGYDVKIETWLEDHRTLFLESAAMFSSPLDLNQPAGRDALSKDIAKADDYINKNIVGFIKQFGE